MSDVAEVDSDIETEMAATYDRFLFPVNVECSEVNKIMVFNKFNFRQIYREDAKVLKAQTKEQRHKGEKKTRAPSGGLKLQHVHGYVVDLYYMYT